jgi:uncharacterized integral membrane protein (TIGR00698 family)
VPIRVHPWFSLKARLIAWPGWVLAALITLVAYGAERLPLPPFRIETEIGPRHPLSAAIIAILLGVVIANVIPLADSIRAGARQIVRHVLPITIVLIGAGLNLAVVTAIGGPAVVLILICILVALVSAWLFSRTIGVSGRFPLLIGAGTAICGSNAIVALAPVIKARENEVGASVAIINIYGLATMLTLPIIAAALGLDAATFGLWAGTSVQAVPQVIAAGFAHSPEAAELATLVKLARVTMIVPLVLIAAVVMARMNRPQLHADERRLERELNSDAELQAIRVHPRSSAVLKLVPWFIWGFVALAILATLFHSEALPDAVREPGLMTLNILKAAGAILLTLSMAAIGLEVNLRELAGVGGKAVLLGLLCSITLAAASLGIVRLLL